MLKLFQKKAYNNWILIIAKAYQTENNFDTIKTELNEGTLAE